jgi:hypothetical protein
MMPMPVNGAGLIFILTSLVWLAVLVYLLVLAGRFVAAVERIADRMGPQP